MRIRRANIEDSVDLARVQVDSYRQAYAGMLPESYLAHFSYQEQAQDWRELLAVTGAGLVYVAESGTGELLGYALGRVQGTGEEKYVGELAAVHVARKHQGQGIGQRLVAAVVGGLETEGCRSLCVWVLAANPARSFYEHLGGQLVGERFWRIEEFGLEAVEVRYVWPNIGDLHVETGERCCDRS